MRVVIQRVAEASVEVGGRVVASIGRGILVLAAFKSGEQTDELEWMARKCLELRIFEDSEGKMNRSVIDEDGEVLVVSQFTLYGNCRKGRRPAYTLSAPADEAVERYRRFIEIMSSYYPKVSEGVFGAKMKVRLTNDGPVTLIVDRGVAAL
ncbi:MAG: D-tyrosyl-tRNA(Tyr) deacylase [bacterium]|nr:MAG: D-tyrosyl-tRNA(Tyr) deacylase [bacterium]